MSLLRSSHNILVAFLLMLPVVLPAAAEDFRTWTMVTGSHFEAKVNEVGNTSITLENREGRIIDFPLADLKPSDQQFARDWQVARLGSDNADAPSAVTSAERSDFARRVYKDLVTVKGKRLIEFKPAPEDQPKYFAFYRSAMWCPPCRNFTPTLAEFYKKQKRKGAAFELVFISSDKSEDLMAEYMKEYDMDWPAFQYGKNKDIVDPYGNGIPNLIVTDANGKKLLDSYDAAGKYIGPNKVLEEFEALLAPTR